MPVYTCQNLATDKCSQATFKLNALGNEKADTAKANFRWLIENLKQRPVLHSKSVQSNDGRENIIDYNKMNM